MIPVNPKHKLRDLMSILSRKFSTSLSPYTHEFRIDIEIDGTLNMEECPVDIDMHVRALKTSELKLCKKTYKDSPTNSPKSVEINKNFEVFEVTKKYKIPKVLSIVKKSIYLRTEISQEYGAFNFMTVYDDCKSPIRAPLIQKV